jgi:hypothetical protein
MSERAVLVRSCGGMSGGAAPGVCSWRVEVPTVGLVEEVGRLVESSLSVTGSGRGPL